MTTLQLPVPEGAAERFTQRSGEQKTRLTNLLVDSLNDQNTVPELMDFIGFKASQRRLTDEILTELLENQGWFRSLSSIRMGRSAPHFAGILFPARPSTRRINPLAFYPPKHE